ncbi:F-box domain-containing protein [Mycena chlorophos]|uniref:F-box domain-containing protein n=1 Tax=Mycena chlorophos TaxID=658473 RepID=A0A8H6TAW5_MYCCL|nr:F-box domain-containing protein [Mycena chlorophos]
MPSLKEMGRLRAAAAAAAASSRNSDLPPSSPSAMRTSSPPPRSNDDNGDNDLPPPAMSLIARVPDLTAFGQRNLKRAKLSAASERDYLEICGASRCHRPFLTHLTPTQTTNPQERQNLETFAVFQFIDKVNELKEEIQQAKASEFKGSTELNAEVRNYTRGFLLDPKTRFYDGTIKESVVEGMRKEQVPKVPSKDAGPAAIKAFLRVVGHQVSVDKNHIKTELEATMAKDAEETDIASVANRILTSWGVAIPLTLELLWRLALMRTTLAEDNGSSFWLAVDKQMHDLRTDADAGVYVYALEENFQEDLKKYGKLDSNIEFDADVGPHSPKWLQRVRKLAPKVENAKATNANAGKSKSSGGRNLKRKRPQMEDEAAGAGTDKENAGAGDAEGAGDDEAGGDDAAECFVRISTGYHGGFGVYAEINACSETFPLARVLLCWWHVLNAWQKKLGTSPGDLWSALLHPWPRITDQAEFDATWVKVQAQAPAGFVEYFRSTWMKPNVIPMWSAVYRKDRNIFQMTDTNMIAESFHHVLKQKFLKGVRNNRMDLLVSVLTNELSKFYIGKQLRQDHGFEGVDVEVKKCAEATRKGEGYGLDDIQVLVSGDYKIKSQRQPTVFYNIDSDVRTCTCADFPLVHFCKHLAAVRRLFPEPEPTVPLFDISTTNISIQSESAPPEPNVAPSLPIHPPTNPPASEQLATRLEILASRIRTGSALDESEMMSLDGQLASLLDRTASTTTVLPSSQQLRKNTSPWKETKQAMGVLPARKKGRKKATSLAVMPIALPMPALEPQSAPPAKRRKTAPKAATISSATTVSTSNIPPNLMSSSAYYPTYSHTLPQPEFNARVSVQPQALYYPAAWNGTWAAWALLRFTGFRDRPKFPRNFWSDVNRALPRLTTLECMRSGLGGLHGDLGSFFLDAQMPQLRVAKLYETGFVDASPPIQLPMNNITHYRGAYDGELHLDGARHLQVCVLGFQAPDADLAFDATRVLLPCLTALYIEGVEFLDWLETPLLDHLSIFGDSDFLPRWDVSSILLFLRRPEYALCLRSLALLSVSLTFASDDLRELLQELPRLEHLTLALAPEEQGTAIITQLLNTNSSLAAQDGQGSGDATPLCPHLTSFKYGAAAADGDAMTEAHAEDLDLLLQLAQSRARRRLRQEPTLTDPAFVLYMYVAYSSEPFVVPRSWPTREQLAEEGLELVVMAGTDSRVQAEFWGDF